MDFNIPPISGGVEPTAPAPRSEPAQGADFRAQLDAAVNVSTLPASPPPSALEDMQKAAAATIPVGRVGRPEDIAHTISYLASDGASFVSGQVIYVAGGPKD